MSKVLILICALLLSACAEYSVSPSINGVKSPNDLVPQPFPDPPPAQD